MASFGSVLKHIGLAPIEVLKWLGSAQGQKVTTEVEAGAEVAFPMITGFVNLFNVALKKIFTMEALGATDVANTPGTALVKSSAVVHDLTPLALAFAETYGLPTPTADQVQNFVDHLVGAGNAFLGPNASPKP